MKILIGCEYSGAVRRAFEALGRHEVISCDLLPADDKAANHHVGDIFELIESKQFDVMIAFPPCTDLASSGAKHFAAKRADGRQQRAIEFVEKLWAAPIPKIAIENPVGVLSTQSKLGKPSQIIQPWQHGHEATKTTCLWLKNLSLLTPTNIVGKGKRHVTKGGKSLPEWYNLPPSSDRWKIRSATFPGIAKAMADAWG